MSSPAVKLSGTLPGGDANGLSSIAAELVDHPRDLRPVIMLIDCNETRTNVDIGEVVPRGRIRRIEPIAPADMAAARRLFRRAHEARTGRTSLPIDTEEEIDSAFSTTESQS